MRINSGIHSLFKHTYSYEVRYVTRFLKLKDVFRIFLNKIIATNTVLLYDLFNN